jgi:hypothetical protein
MDIFLRKLGSVLLSVGYQVLLGPSVNRLLGNGAYMDTVNVTINY